MNWLLVRGLGRVREHWLDFPEKLKATLGPNDQVLCLDLPGFGSEREAKVPLTIAGNAEYIRETFFRTRQEAGKDNWGIVGLSLGGMVALEWVSKFRTDFKRLVVINTSARDTSTLLQRLTPFALYTAGRIFSAKDAESRERHSLKLISNLRSKDKELLKKHVEINETYPLLRDKIWLQLAAAAIYNSPAIITIPTLVISSLKDKMVDSRCSKTLAEKLSTNAGADAPVNIKFHSTAGHDLPIDDPDWLVDRIVEFEALSASTKI